jgi:hypothetical protein
VQDRKHLARVFKSLKALAHVSRVRSHHPEGLGRHMVKHRFGSMLKSVASLGQTIAKPFKKKTQKKDKVK